MAVVKYTVKGGDTVWGICISHASSISGNTTLEKRNTVLKLNPQIKSYTNASGSLIDIICAGMVITLSTDGTSTDGTSTESTTSSSNAPVITSFGLIASDGDTPNRSMVANWTWDITKYSDTAGYTVVWKQYQYDKWVETKSDITEAFDTYCQSIFNANEDSTKVQFQVRPYYKKNNEITYWDDVPWSDAKIYDFSDNPPLIPPVPTIKIEDLVLTMTFDSIDPTKLDATCVKFNVIKDNVASVYTSPPIQILSNSIDDGPLFYYTSHQYTVKPGSEYKVRACSVNSKEKLSGWSEFSENVGTKPSAPTAITICRKSKDAEDGTVSVYLEWTEVSNVTSYVIEYTDKQVNFDNPTGNVTAVTTDNKRTSLEILDLDTGTNYFFRVRAVNDVGESDPSPITAVVLGEPPGPPTTWSSSKSAFTGENMELNWIHNTSDGSPQKYAELYLRISDGNGDDEEFKVILKNDTNAHSGETTETYTFKYGQAISYKGELHVKMDTSHANLKNKEIVWKVRTAGVSNEVSDTSWSTERTIYIYEKPTLILSMVKDLASPNGTIVENLDSFPFYIRASVDLDSDEYKIQRPIGYHLRIVSNTFYETVDDTGRTKSINPGDAVYSKYFDVIDPSSPDLRVEMSANNIDLEPGINYTVYCDADMSTGLSTTQSYDFSVNWADIGCYVDATISLNTTTYTALITPRCVDSDGGLVENITISVYRRGYDGSYTEIAKNVPNNGTSVTDPHPALDYARYRLVAKNTLTGAVSFYDMAGYPVKGKAVIIQWDEEWSTFNVGDNLFIDGPDWSGSMVKLPYDIDVIDSRKREVEFARYVGRENPVSYYGTHRSETSTWNVSIPKEDKETIYALRRLSLWSGDVYVREPSGMGYWANVTVRFNQKHKNLIIPVTIDITRVEGGM